MASSSPPKRRDRLSELPDFLLGDVLSYLPNKEAGRAAVLSRRWRHVFCSVDTVSFAERAGARSQDWTTFYYDAKERKSCSWVLLDSVWSALLCRRRCAGFHVPLRSFLVAMDRCHWWDRCHVDQWLSYVLRYSGQELHLDLRFRLGRICEHGNNDESYDERRRRDGWYELPPKLFSFTAMRSLCLSYCGLNLPAVICLPFLETLRLTGVERDSESSIQRLIASCPRLVDLTLEANKNLGKVSVLDRRLRRFALRCCHNMRTVDIDASDLRSLDYRGTVPTESVLSLHGLPEAIPSCTVDFCKVIPVDPEHHMIKMFLEKISGAKRLHLHYRCLPASSFERLPSFHNLTRLALQGPLHSPAVVRVILEHMPNLEILSFFMELAVVVEGLLVPDESSFAVPCLQSRVKEINMVHYQDDVLQRTMAWLLLRNALVLERMCVVLAKGPFPLQEALTMEIQSWMVATDAEQIFL
ncbi:hypothetical protein QYE76_047135 [Lolium multiflorum]|uniref:F-box domain-containing protein n=1 Tax=Lolium multiflorum TaxID=4521 RepID=A0AAD8TR60_LOLMU|nr:hypothetical protein QYE76_047135 [Lolium multiflorum]